MNACRWLLCLAAQAGLLVAMAPACGQAPAGTASGGAAPQASAAGKEFLLAVSKGQIPPDTAMEDKTTLEIVESKELGGKALKVPFAPGDSFGIRPGPAKNWKRFVAVRFDAFNPSQAEIDLAMTVIHARSTSFQTRVVVPFKLKPGKNEISLGIDEMANTNGSAPDLANVTKWYIHDLNEKGPTVLFGDIWLEGGSTGPAPADQGAVPVQPSRSPVGYRIKGKFGDTEVDLTVTPLFADADTTAGTQGKSSSAVGSDPSRVSRIRAAVMPKVEKVTNFDTPAADAICSALEIFPPDNPWNLVVEQWPLHPNSRNIIASIGAEKRLRYNDDMSFIIVPPDQPKVDVKLVAYAAESDKGPYPVPDSVPIEGWPSHYLRRAGGEQLALETVQRDRLKEEGDRHAIVVDPTNRMLYEFFQMKKTDQGWQAACAAIFDLKSNKLRPETWTSTDAAGLPVFPAVVRHDELERGLVEHAMRVTVRNTRQEYVYPARHYASTKTDDNLPRMGERIRLRQDFDVAGFSPQAQAILKGLKKYGVFVADNGIEWAISVAPDPRIPVLHEELRKVKGSDFEVVEPPPGYVPPEQAN